MLDRKSRFFTVKFLKCKGSKITSLSTNPLPIFFEVGVVYHLYSYGFSRKCGFGLQSDQLLERLKKLDQRAFVVVAQRYFLLQVAGSEVMAAVNDVIGTFTQRHQRPD